MKYNADWNRCIAITKEGMRCPIRASKDGLCHIHHPDMPFQQQRKEYHNQVKKVLDS